MLNLEIDGKAIQVPHGSTVMDATSSLGLYVPHFCYHKKLSIAANCRMCLVQVEKAPKPLPACATPVTEGMKVWTHSTAAVDAQKGVMEFLLINHPLDCPICDQGGECQLQDLAVGYGGSNSRYQEPKRVVFNKNLGPLIATDMTRCIHCTRCVRFGVEVAGVMELGMANRGEHAEIMTFVGHTVDSELSGNMIDLCPVGALTSKPFRYMARTWELSRRKSISPHDALGSKLIVQVKTDRVMRVLPLEDEDINECWLSDRDRFSYEGLYADDRLTMPMIKQRGPDGETWKEVDWQTALTYVADGLRDTVRLHGAESIGALASPHSTVEELHLLQRLIRGLGSDNIDFRLRQADFADDEKRAGIPWLGMTIAEVSSLDRALVVGSFLRKDQPLLAQRLRQATKEGLQLNLLHVTGDDPLMRVANQWVVRPSELERAIAEIIVAISRMPSEHKGMLPTELSPEFLSQLPTVEPSPQSVAVATSLAGGSRRAIFLGNFAGQHPRASNLRALVQILAKMTGAKVGVLTEAANTVGGHLVSALPQKRGLNALAMLQSPRKAYILLHLEAELDLADPVLAAQALDAADFVVALTPFKQNLAHADVLLPIAPFTETGGTFVNCEGRVQSFNGVVKPLEDTRPGWKVLRVLGSLLGLTGFEFDRVDAVRIDALGSEVPDLRSRLSNDATLAAVPPSPTEADQVERIADVPIYFSDPLVRRSAPLQKTADARIPRARMSSATLATLALADSDDSITVTQQGGGNVALKLAIDETVAPNCIRISAAHASTKHLGPMFGTLTVKRGQWKD